MQDKGKKKIVYSTALYIRLSKADERKGADRFSESIENQQIILHDYIDSNNEEFVLYKEYVDDGITGTDDLMRPAFMEMIKDLKAGKINCIITKDPSEYMCQPCFSKVLRRKHANIIRKFYRQQTEP